MGCFNVACSVSNISIGYGTQVVYIPLQKNRLGGLSIGDRNDMLIYSNCFYNPATLPIKGIYNNYGALEDIEKNNNVEFLEDYFQRSIEDIIDVRNGENVPEGITSGMFVHRAIYNQLSTKHINEFGQPLSVKGHLENDYDRIKEAIPKIRELVANLYDDPDNGRAKMIFESRLETQINSPLLWRTGGIIKKLVREAISRGILKEEMVEFGMFHHGMYHVNAFYFPAMNGLQYGNAYMSKNLYALAHDIAQAHVMKMEEEF